MSDLFGVPLETTRKPWFSPSRLKTFVDCPRRYQFQFVLKLPTLPSPVLDLGNNVHAALRDWLRLPPKQRTVDNLLGFHRTAWLGNRKAFERLPRESLKQAGEQGIRMLRRFAEEVAPDLEPLMIEKTVSADYGDVVIGGRVDRVDALPDGSLRVVDYKTGKFPKSPSRFREEDLAAGVYARATTVAFAGTPVAEVELHYLESGERIVFPVDEAWQAHKDLAVVSAALAAHEAEKSTSFEPRPGPLCKWCDFKARCPEGKAFLDAPPGPR